MKNGTPTGLWPPQARAASYVLRPLMTAPALATAVSGNSLSAPVVSPRDSSP